MREALRSFRDPNVRGAFTLGAVLLFVIAVGLVGSFFVFRQLDEASKLQASVGAAHQAVDDLLRMQLDEETALRGYVATGQRAFLEPYLNVVDRFESRVRTADVRLRNAGLEADRALLARILELHRAWEERTARPLMADLRRADAGAIEAVGKAYVDEMRGNFLRLRNDLDVLETSSTTGLKQRVNRTIVLSAGSILVFGLITLLAVFGRSRALSHLDRERIIVETLQRAFFVGWDELPKARVGTSYISATAGAVVGGDLIDVRRIDEHRGLVLIADVSGKGIGAAVKTAFVKYSIRTLSQELDDPGEILARFNRLYLTTIDEPSSFVVVFLGIFDGRTLTLRYASAGLGTAYVRRGSSVEQLPGTGPLVGLWPDDTFGNESIALAKGDTLVLATDGLTEARDRNGEFLNDEGAMNIIAAAPSEPQAFADNLVARVTEFSGGRIVDDLALLVVQVG